MKRRISFISLFLVCLISFSSHAVLLSNQTQTPSMSVTDIEIPNEDGVIFDFDNPRIEDSVGNWSRHIDNQTISSWIGENLDIPQGGQRGRFYNLTMQTVAEESLSNIKDLDIAGGIWIKLSDEMKQAIPKFSGLSFDIYLEAEDVFDELVIELKDGDEIITQFIYSVEDLKNGEWQTLAVPVNFDAQKIEDLTLVVGLRGVYSEEEQNVFIAIDDVKLDTSEDFSFKAQQDKRSDYFGYGIFEEMVEQLKSSEPGERAAAVWYLGRDVPSCKDEVIRLNVAKALKPLLDDSVISLISAGVTDIRVRAIDALAQLFPTLGDENYKKNLATYMFSSRFFDNREITIQRATIGAIRECAGYIDDERRIQLTRYLLDKMTDSSCYEYLASSIIDAFSGLFPFIGDNVLKKDIVSSVLSVFPNAHDGRNSIYVFYDCFNEFFEAAKTLIIEDDQLGLEVASRIVRYMDSYSYGYREEFLEDLIPYLGPESQKVLIGLATSRFLVGHSPPKVDVLSTIADNVANDEVRDDLIQFFMTYIKEAPCCSDEVADGVVDSLDSLINSFNEEEKTKFIRYEMIDLLKGDATFKDRIMNMLVGYYPDLEEREQLMICEALAIVATSSLYSIEDRCNAIKTLGYGIVPLIENEDLKEKIAREIASTFKGEHLYSIQDYLGNIKKAAIEVLASVVPKIEDEDLKVEFIGDIADFIDHENISTVRIAVGALVNEALPAIEDEELMFELSQDIISLIDSEDLNRRIIACDAIGKLISLFDSESIKLELVKELLKGFEDNAIEVRREAIIENFVPIFPTLSEDIKLAVAEMLVQLLGVDRPEVRYNVMLRLGDTVFPNIENDKVKFEIVKALGQCLEDARELDVVDFDGRIFKRKINRIAGTVIVELYFRLSEDEKLTIIGDVQALLHHQDSEVKGVSVMMLKEMFEEMPSEKKEIVIEEMLSLLGDVSAFMPGHYFAGWWDHSRTIREEVLKALAVMLPDANENQKAQAGELILELLEEEEFVCGAYFGWSGIFQHLPTNIKPSIFNQLLDMLSNTYYEEESLWGTWEATWKLLNHVLKDESPYIYYMPDEQIERVIDRLVEGYNYGFTGQSENLIKLFVHIPDEKVVQIRDELQNIVMRFKEPNIDDFLSDYYRGQVIQEIELLLEQID
ncbi:MAG: hypothetical protein P9M06_03880 [Candidatus Saelkia tenebricola]|nr:hypothetical protein [Candidatus Saelkia tenebricola]